MADRQQRRGGASYQDVDASYLDKRSLRKGATTALLWALGVGAVISGDYFGWNFGLAAGGFWGMCIATMLMALMYVCMVFSIAELSAALPHAGGFYAFTRSALGPLGGYLCGATDTIEYVITPAVIVDGIGGYLSQLVPDVPPFVWWLLAYGIFVTINIRGVELTLRVGLVITVLALAVLVVFYAGALSSGAFSVDKLFNIAADTGQSMTFLPRGARGIFAALPYAIWFYLAIEQLPLAAEEAHDAASSMPRALLYGIGTLLLFSLLTLVLNSGVGGGALAVSSSKAPLEIGLSAVFGGGATTAVLTMSALAGLVASFHSVIYAYGRVLFSLSRAGYFPRWISLTSKNQTPHVALVLGAVIGLGATFAIDRFRKGVVGAALLNMAVFGAVISYALVMLSYIRLRLLRPELPRPYRSPLGVPGAAVGALLSVVALTATFYTEEYRPAVYGVAIFVALALVYYLAYSRTRLVAQAPEEQVALSRDEHGP